MISLAKFDKHQSSQDETNTQTKFDKLFFSRMKFDYLLLGNR
jgi:hypothetical protein